ncbi:hypothetical protein ACQPXM_28615 [Kribbella sp. CA-253562]|uniref:hypothetical protein n=1 Tax=Kribbella sp. CA-253562 TaxID=3239942 RepID=UPI003D92382B
MSEEVPQITVGDLRAVFDILMKRLEVEGKDIEFSADYYWSVPANELTNVYEEPTQLTVGQISETWMNLVELRDGRSDALAYGAVWLGDILRVIGSERTI